MLCPVLSAAFASGISAAGPFKVAKVKTFEYKAMDVTNRKIDVIYPEGAKGEIFPLISYAHGFSDSGEASYPKLAEDMASYGYVIAFPQACKMGCLENRKSEKGDPPFFGNYYKEQMKVFDWAQTEAAAELPINHTAGYGISGHSMGGQATLFSAAYNATPQLKAAVMHHAFTHTYPAPKIPFLAFTGTDDDTAPSYMAEGFYDASGACSSKGIVNKVGANHHEPTSSYNPKLALYTVAWFKVFLDGTPSVQGTDFADLLFGTKSDSLCGGGDGKMKKCEVHRS